MIKVASYNMRKSIGTDRRRRPERTLQVLCEINADVIALQEADRRFGPREAVLTGHLLAEHGDWKAIPFGMRARSMGWHGNALLVRKDAQIMDCEAIHLPALEPRGAVMADIRVGGQALRIVGMHLDLSGLWRRRQAHAIIAHLQASTRQYPTVLMGDLNEWSPQQRAACAISPSISISPPPARASMPAARWRGSIASWSAAISRSARRASMRA